MEPGAWRGERPPLSISEWAFAAWTAGIFAALIVVEAATALWWESTGLRPSDVTLEVLALLLSLGLWFAGLFVFWTLGVLGDWLFETARGLANSMRSPRA